jgi:hypothetical protein
MKPRAFPTLAVLAVLLVAVGCATPERRIGQHGELFASFSPEVQAKIRQGIVQLGYTPDMVYLAAGPPRHTQERIDESGTTLVWRYTAYRWHPSPPHWRRWPYDPWYGSPLYYWDDREEYDVLRIEFRDDRVVAIEQVVDTPIPGRR